MPCFPSLLVYVACCPPEALLSTEEVLEVGCPPQYARLRTEDCCGPPEGRAATVLAELAGAGLEEGGEGPEQHSFVLDILERLLLDYDLHNAQAWGSLAVTTARDAVRQADVLSEEWVQAFASQEARGHALAALPDVFQRAAALSRRLAKAALRIEDFQQFLVAQRAVAEFKEYYNVDLDSLRGAFGPALELYKTVVERHNYLAFQVLPRLQTILRPMPQVDAAGPPVNLLFLSAGRWARSGFVTLWSILQKRSLPLRVFVLGDAAGLEDWRGAVEELLEGPSADRLRDVTFEYVDFAANARFRDFRRRYPRGCAVDDIGWALLARTLCHELLPADVSRVIALDCGDVLVLDDVRNLWEQFQNFEEHHLLGAPFVAALHHVSAGAVLYDTARMRQRNFTASALRAARDALRRSGDCIHDQSLLNTLHLHRAEHGYAGPSPVLILPCRWMLVPSTEWQMHWNQPERWLPELAERRRYPGLVSSGHIEVYCPDALDMLSAWSFLVVTEDGPRRLRKAVQQEASLETRYCAEEAGWSSRCCRCREGASLVHIPGDMKTWPLVSALLRMHGPAWKQGTAVGPATDSLTRGFWLRSERRSAQRRHQQDSSPAIAAAYRTEVCFDDEDTGRKCCALQTRPVDTMSGMVAFQTVNLEASPPPLQVWVETTAPHDAHLLLGQGPHDAVEVILGAGGGAFSAMQWLVFGGPPVKLAAHTGAPQQRPSGTAADGRPKAEFRVRLGQDGGVEVNHADAADPDASWGVYLPESFMEKLRGGPLRLYVGTPPEVEAGWVVCRS